MRDIVYKKVGARSTAAAISLSSPQTTAPRAAQLAEQLLSIINTAGGWLRQRFEESELTIITPAERPAVLLPRAKKAKRQLAKASLHKVKETGHRAKRTLKTPVGKVALVNGVAVLALFGYVAFNHRTADNALTTQNAVAQVKAGDVRRYLPQAHTSTETPFRELSASVPHAETTLNAWVTPWNIGDLNDQLSSYRSVSAFWVTLADNGYDIVPKADWKQWKNFVTTHQNVKGQQLYLTVSADPNVSYKALTDLDTQQKQIASLLAVVKDQKFDGIDIDYEGLGLEDKDLFTNFIRALTAAFHDERKLVAVTVEARIGNQVPLDWHNLGQIADQIRVMAYDYHSRTTNFPGPVAPLSWVKDVTSYAVANIDPAKVIVGLGNYGYDWQQSADDPNTWQGVGLSFDQAMALSKAKSAPVTQATGIDDRGYDIGTVPTFTYKDDTGAQHSVWFEDSNSLQNKVDLVSQYPVQGVIFWSVGLGDKDFWNNPSSAR